MSDKGSIGAARGKSKPHQRPSMIPWRRRWPGRDCAKLWVRYANKDEVSVELPLTEAQRKRVDRFVARLIAEAAHAGSAATAPERRPQ